MKTLAALALAAFAFAGSTAAAPRPGPFAPWIDGTAASEPQTQTQRYGRDTYVIRQSVKTNFEGPFLYLLFGRDRALLVDTGAGNVKIRPVVEAAIAQWLAEHHRASIPLVVAHSHGHGDHRQGDGEFRDRPDTVVVGLTPAEVAAFFGVKDWPTDVVRFDLGRRPLWIIPAPGHQPSHIVVYDPQTRLLLTGDTLYPGRLYVPANTFQDYRDSIDRVVKFVGPRKVAWALGAHIEMTRDPGVELPDRPPHRNEHVLELRYARLLELQAALHAMGDKPVRQVHDDFVIQPTRPR